MLKISKPIKYILAFLAFIAFLSISINLSAQNFEFLLKEKKDTEKDLWKKERLNYYVDSREMNQRFPESYFWRGQEKLQKGSYREAISDFKKAISKEDFPGSTIANADKEASNRNAYFRISLCYQQLQQSDSALFFCQKAIEEDKYFLGAYIQKAALLSDMNKYKEASEFLDAAETVFPDSKKIFFTKAQIYLQQEKIAKAKRYLKKASDIDPDFDEANVLLATIYIYDYNIDAAMRILTKSINEGKKPIISLYYRSIIYLISNEMDKAYSDLNRAYLLDTINNPVTPVLISLDYFFKNYDRANRLLLEYWSRNVTKNGVIDKHIDYTSYELGYFLKFLHDNPTFKTSLRTFNSMMHQIFYGKKEEATTIVDRYVQIRPGSIFAKRLQIYSHLSAKEDELKTGKIYQTIDFSAVLEKPSYFPPPIAHFQDIDKVISLDSSIPSMYWIKSKNEYIRGKYKDAVATANKGIEIDPSFLEPYYVRALSNIRLHNYKQAVNDFKKLEESDYDNNAYKFAFAYTCFIAGDYKIASDINLEIIDNVVLGVVQYSNQALCYEMMNMPDSAIIYYTLANAEMPLDATYTREIVRIYKNIGEYGKAIEVLKDAAEYEYSDFMLTVDIADLYVEMGAYENAITYYKKAYQNDRSYTYAYLGAADCYRILGKYETALNLYDKAIKNLPEHAYSYYAKGLCYFNMEDYENSVKTTYEAILLNDAYAAAYKLMADNYFILKRYSVSVSMGLNALKYDPGNKAIMYQMAASTLARGNTDEAIAFYKKIIDTELEEKSEAYAKAIEMLHTMISNNIQTEEAEQVLDVVFGEGD